MEQNLSMQNTLNDLTNTSKTVLNQNVLGEKVLAQLNQQIDSYKKKLKPVLDRY